MASPSLRQSLDAQVTAWLVVGIEQGGGCGEEVL